MSARRRATTKPIESPVSSRAVDAAFVVTLVVTGATPLWAVYEHPAALLMAVGALVFGGAIAVLGALRSLPAYVVAAISAVVYLVIGVGLAVPTEAAGRILPTATGLRDLVLGSVTAWKRMLSVDLPLGDYGALLVPAFVVLFAATIAGVSLALRARQSGWAILSPAGVLAFAIAFGSRTATRPIAAGIVFLVLALAWAMWTTMRHPGARPADTSRTVSTTRRRPAVAPSAGRLVAAGVLIALCAGGGVLGATRSAPAQSREVLRTAVQPPFDPHHYPSPLVTYRNSVLAPGKTTAMLTISGLPAGARVRVATLDDYNGLVFAAGSSASSGTFSRVASTITQNGVVGRSATVSITVRGYSDVWLPTVGSLTSIDFAGSDASQLREAFFYDRATSSAAVLGGVEQGDSYTMSTIVPTQLSDSALESLRPGDAAQPRATNVPKAIVDAAKKQAGSASTPGAKLVALTKWLRAGYVSHSQAGAPFSASGHAASRLASLVTDTPMLGDAEQYAPALALLARQIGFPARVVLGYAPTASSLVDGRATLTGADLTAWVEVEAANGQWVAVDPNPPVRPVPDNKTKQSEAIAHPQTVLPPPPPSKNDTAVTQNRDSQKTKHDAGLPIWLQITLAVLRVAAIVLVIAAIVLAPFWVIAVARFVRRRRRRRLDRDAVVVTGAWNEILDSIVDRGYDVPRAATRSEVAALVGATQVQTLAEKAERSVFSSQPLAAADVDAYWSTTFEAQRALGADEGRWPRIRYHLSARSLVGRARRRMPDQRLFDRLFRRNR